MRESFVSQLRDETPGCQHVLHFNNAGAALPPRVVVEAVKQHLDLESHIGGYEAAEVEAKRLERVYDAAAQLIHCQRDEIAFTENATRAWDMAFYGMRFNAGDRVITDQARYASNYLAFLQVAKQKGIVIELIDNDAYGQLDVHDLERKLNKSVKLIAITHIPTQGGLINPVVAVGKIATKNKIPYLLDATQSIGQMPVDTQEIGCDFLCATGRKFLRGPRGTGFLYAKRETLAQVEPPFIDLHAAKWLTDTTYQIREDARRFETWEQNIAAKIGLGVAIDYALQIGMQTIWERVSYLSCQLRVALQRIPSITLQDLGQHQCGIVTFTSSKITAPELQQELNNRKINISISLAEYARLDLVKRKLPALIRASIHYYNTEAEIERFCDELRFLG